MEQHTLFYTNITIPMSNESQNRNQSRDLTRKASCMPTFAVGKDVEDNIEDEESEFKMGGLIRQASLNSSQMDAPLQITKVLTGCYPSRKLETNQEIKISKMRKFESMKERSSSRTKNSMKMNKNNIGCAPTLIPWGCAADKASSEDIIKAQIKFWARAVAFNVHQEC